MTSDAGVAVGAHVPIPYPAPGDDHFDQTLQPTPRAHLHIKGHALQFRVNAFLQD